MRRLPFLLAAVIPAAVSAQNSCSTALPVTMGFSYTVQAVDGEVPLPDCLPEEGPATHGEWYVFTSEIDQSLTVTTDLPQNNGDDTRVHVYSGTCGALVCVAADDHSGTGDLAALTCSVQAGQTYYIAFDDAGSASGFSFIVSDVPIVFPPEGVTFTAGLTPMTNVDGIVDMDGDHLDDLVSTGSASVTIAYQLANGSLGAAQTYPTPVADHTASWSFCAGDIDHNGFTDMMYGGGGGATFMMAGGADGHTYTEVSFQEYIFCQRTNMVDLDNDGDLDAFSCHDVDANVYFLNDGTGALTFHQGGLGPTCGNYGSIWTDYDNDGDQDLFIAKCGCDPVDLFMRNTGDLVFESIAEENGFADEQQSWSSAWGDFDNDGDMDVLVGSSGGPLQKLMRNDDGSFTNVTAGSGFDQFGGSSIEWVAHDFNNDGWVDVLGGGALHLNNHDMTFTAITDAPDNGPIGDVNNDGFLDIMGFGSLFLNDGNDNSWLTVNTVGTVSNADGIGARVEITSALGTQIRDVRSGDGFRYMSSLNTHFGLGPDDDVQELVVRWPSGVVTVLHDIPADQAITVVEGMNVGVEEVSGNVLGVYPNPVLDVLYVPALQNEPMRTVRLTDASGRLVRQGILRNGTLDVAALPAGAYVLELQGSFSQRTRFVKQ